MFAKNPHEAVSCALPDRAAIATRAEMVPKPCGWHTFLDSLALAVTSAPPMIKVFKGPRMVDHVRLMTVCQSKSSDLFGETRLLLRATHCCLYTLTFWTLEISRVRMQTPGLPVTWGKSRVFSTNRGFVGKNPGFSYFAETFNSSWDGAADVWQYIWSSYHAVFLSWPRATIVHD